MKKKTKEIKWFIQRGRRGYADCDVWGLNYYLAKLLAGSIKQLGDEPTGHPPDLSYSEWENILKTMALGFEEYVKNEDGDDYSLKEFRKSRKKLKNSLKLFSKYFNDLWD